MSFAAVGSLYQETNYNTPPILTVNPSAIGNFILCEVLLWGSSSVVATALSGGDVTSWTRIASYDSTFGNDSTAAMFLGTVTSTGSSNITITMSGSTTGCDVWVVAHEFSSTGGAQFDSYGTIDASNTNHFPTVTPAGAGELYFGYCFASGSSTAGSTSGYSYAIDVGNNGVAWNTNCTASAQAPNWGSNNLFFGLAVLIKSTGGTALTGSGSLAVPIGFSALAARTQKASASLTITPEFQAFPAGGTEAMVLSQAVAGNVINDYGLDNVPFTLHNPGTGSMLAAFIGWNVAEETYQSSGKAPAVNVTDSAGNLWRQVGISSASTSARGALWVADNPRQTNWVSVALTGWAYSTAYSIVEFNSVPTSLQAVSLDFVSATVNTNFVTGLTVPTATATGSDIVLAVVATGGQGGPLTIPTGYTGIQAAGGYSPGDVTTYSMYNPSHASGSVTFTPTWASSVPASGIIAGIKMSATAPTQTNPNMPNVVVEAAFGATPGDWTQSVDYTWDVQGLTWTDISSRAFSKGDDANITVKRGRQYELSQEETGEIDIRLDNHDGAFTSGNTNSPYYPYVIPGVPIRVTAWFDGVQYPVGFGYVERWPQDWPDMPQWGFAEVTATDTYGPLANTSLPSAVKGDIRKDIPYAYFPTEEQYEFTTQSLTPTAAPLDANGLIAVDYAFGNNRYGAYRDGMDQPVTTGQALNLLGDENTCLGATTYTGQEMGTNGPGMFYFDPNIPVNANSNGFSVEFWFVWGNGPTFECAMMTAFGRPSSFYQAQANTAITNGANVIVGINTGLDYAASVPTGFWVNGIEVSAGAFNQTTFAPQHFVLTTGPNGTTCYLNGAPTPVAPSLPVIPQVKAVALGPAAFSYDVSGLAVYNGYNYVAGHLAWYGYELTETQVSNHFESGFTGWAGTPAPGRFAQVLTWGQLGLKRGGTAWYGSYGSVEGTYISEAYQYEGTNASDVINQVVQTEGGRCFTQGNGSIVYTYRWDQYNQSAAAVFGDNNTTEIPFEQNTAFSVDNQFLYNLVSSTQNRGPNQDLFYQYNNSQSQLDFFMRSGLQYQNYALMPFDVFDQVNWATQKYAQPRQRVSNVEIDVSKVSGKFSSAFPTILGLELNDTVTVNRRPVGGSAYSVTGAIQSVQHEIGATYWKTTYQIAPLFPESQTLFADVPGQNSPGTQYLSW